MIFQHHRFAIYNLGQHPYKHTPADVAYTSSTLPTGSVVNLQQALDWVFAVIYPQTKAAVATIADLPAVGNTLNDYRVVQDNGSGKSQGYRWEQREGEASASWHLISEIDWGADSVLQQWEARTQDAFVMRRGYDDLDNTGAKVAGTLAGQSVFGGAAASSNLTLWPNSGDGAGAVTGYVQFASHTRPTVAGVYDMGTAALKYRTGYFGTSVLAGTMTISGGTVADSSGAVSFGALNLTTTGTMTFGTATTLTAGSGTLSSSSGTISLGANNLSTSGTLAAGVATVTSVQATTALSNFKTGTTIGHLTFTDGQIVDSSGSLTFSTTNLLTSGTLGAGASTLTSAAIGSVSISGSTVTTSAGALVLNSSSGTLTVSATTVTMAGTLAVTTSIARGSTVLTDGQLTAGATATLTLVGSTSLVLNTPLLSPTSDATTALGAAAKRFTTVYLGTGISDGTNSIPMATLLSFRAALTGAGSGMTLFYDGSLWNPSLPDTEITHSTLSGLTTGDAGHTQFNINVGRAGGQSLEGGTAASENLTLSSTHHATKGFIILTSTLQPTDITYALGDTTHRFTNLYMNGQAVGMRLENAANVAGLPAASASNPGRLAYEAGLKNVYVDNGGAWVKVGADVYYNQDASGWSGAVTTVTYDVSATFIDARKATWQFQDNSNNHKIIGCDITFPSATQVTVTVDIALASGTYTLVGVG